MGGLTQVLANGTHSYLYGDGRIGEELFNDWQYHLSDGLGSVRQLADHMGEVTLAKGYEPYGEVLDSAGNASTSYGYAGEWTDYTGLIYLRARYYDPTIARFGTRDSWGGDMNQPMSYNAWLYVYSNPVIYVDPTGHYLGDGESLPDKRDLTDWLPRAAVYMATDTAKQEIYRLNSTDNAYKIIKGYIKFYNLVRPGARFDVKIKIRSDLGRSIELGDDWFEYSITGNFLYGFYGTAAGYEPEILHKGAGVAQIMELIQWIWINGKPCDFPDVGGPQHYFDTPDDSLAVDFGI